MLVYLDSSLVRFGCLRWDDTQIWLLDLHSVTSSAVLVVFFLIATKILHKRDLDLRIHVQ